MPCRKWEERSFSPPSSERRSDRSGRGSDELTSAATRETAKPETSASFGRLNQIDAGLLNVGYAEAGPADGPP
jgi:hypothetical protein